MSVGNSLEDFVKAMVNENALSRSELSQVLDRLVEWTRGGESQVDVPPGDLVTQTEAADRLQIAPQRVSQWLARGLLHAYPRSEGRGRRGPRVSLAEVAVLAMRGTVPAMPAVLNAEFERFLERLAAQPGALANELGQLGSDLLTARGDQNLAIARAEQVSRVLTDLLSEGMTSQEVMRSLSRDGTEWLRALPPLIQVPLGGQLHRLFGPYAQGGLDMVVETAAGVGFDTASAATLALLGAAIHAQDQESDYVGVPIQHAAAEIWGQDWLDRLLDLAFYIEDLAPKPLTRYTSSLVYLGCNRFVRQAQRTGISLTNSSSPGALLPLEFYGTDGLAAELANRTALPVESIRSSLRQTDKNYFRRYNFERGLFDASVGGVRRYCYFGANAAEQLRSVHGALSQALAVEYRALAIERTQHVLQTACVELAVSNEPFDWWRMHLTRCSANEVLLSLRDQSSKRIAHGLLLSVGSLPEILEAMTASRREQLRLYLQQFNYDYVDERYRRDVSAGRIQILKHAGTVLDAEVAHEQASKLIDRYLSI